MAVEPQGDATAPSCVGTCYAGVTRAAHSRVHLLVTPIIALRFMVLLEFAAAAAAAAVPHLSSSGLLRGLSSSCVTF